MKPRTPFYRPALLALGISLGSGAAQAGSLIELFDLAVANDPQIRSAAAQMRAGQEALPQARSQLLPNLLLGADSTWTDTENAGSFNSEGVTLSLNQSVFSASRWYNLRRGEALSRQAELVFDQAQQTLILRTVSAYLDVLRALNNLESARAEERAIKRQLDQVNAQFEVGLIAITDVQEAQASYDNSVVRRIEAEGDLDNSYEALDRLAGEPFRDVTKLQPDYPIEPPQPAEPEPWLEKAWQNNLGLQVADSSIEAARRSAQSARAGHYPTLDLNASYDTDGSGISGDVGETGTIALALNLPLYQGGLTSSQTREAEALLDQAMQDRQDTLLAVTQQTRSLLRNLRTNVQSVKARAQSIRSGETALEATQEGFNVGTRNVVDVLNAERNLYAAQRDYANARLDYIANLFSLKQQLGTLNPGDVATLDKWLLEQES
ncbi:channel protein TolC [Marinobacterium nitratireducens]|uniref:Channel protein TolC n=1 Tax=Marinobacterium nitratireducens TaxID=518897 RepID=A0A918DQ17_9GAMM|nr:TolC family outer membrane protein [Marinobacterium nitratireducens]GGO79414.1 channel protein TolC [Marinobacterium nitratireducens]